LIRERERYKGEIGRYMNDRGERKKIERKGEIAR